MSSATLRRPALDGLRGLAALVVLIHHSLLIAPSLADGYLGEGVRGSTGSWPWLLLYTPLHIVWAGGEAVFVFFVLSGLVLALPAAAGRTMSWRAYYPSRLVRLYLPIVAATAFALVLVHLVARDPRPSSSWWLAAHTSSIGLHEAIRDATVVRGATWLNSAFWSLQWEVEFSLLLPLFLLALVTFRRAPVLQVLALLGLSAVGNYTSHPALVYLPIFGLGVVLAAQLGRLDRIGHRLGLQPRLTRAAVAVAAGLLVVAHWWSAPVSGTLAVDTVALVLTLVGAGLIVWLFASTPDGIRLGTRRPVRWLGKRSFSLYLVHEPIVVTTAYVFHGTRNAVLVLLVAVPLSLVAAEIFGRLCEGPSHRLAQRVGRRFRARQLEPAAP